MLQDAGVTNQFHRLQLLEFLRQLQSDANKRRAVAQAEAAAEAAEEAEEAAAEAAEEAEEAAAGATGAKPLTVKGHGLALGDGNGTKAADADKAGKPQKNSVLAAKTVRVPCMHSYVNACA